MSKFKATIDKQFLASDGTPHKTREAHEQHERTILVNRVAGYDAADFYSAVLGDDLTVATDVILLASLLRPPRAKRKGQSEAGPTAPSTTESVSTTVQTAPEATDVAGHDQPPVAAAPSEQPEAAGVSPAPVASDSPDARAPTEEEARMDAYQHGKVDASAGAEPRGHKRGKREGAAT